MPVVETDPAAESAGREVSFGAHAERGDDAFDAADADTSAFAELTPSPAGRGAHALDRAFAMAVAVDVEDGDEVRGAGEEGLRVVRGEEEGVRGGVFFRRGGDEGVGRYYR